MDQSTADTEFVTRQLDVPHHLRALSSLDRVDYADSFLMRVPDPRRWPAERWARLVLTDAPPELRARLVTGWLALGLKLSRHPGSILGWTVRIGTPDHVLLGAGSHVGMPAELMFKREACGVRFCTFVAHENALARAMWTGTEPVHGRVVPSLLRGACERCDQTDSAACSASSEDARKRPVKNVASSPAVVSGRDEMPADRE